MKTNVLAMLIAVCIIGAGIGGAVLYSNHGGSGDNGKNSGNDDPDDSNNSGDTDIPDPENVDTPSTAEISVYYLDSLVSNTTICVDVSEAAAVMDNLIVKIDDRSVTDYTVKSTQGSTISSGDSFTITVSYEDKDDATLTVNVTSSDSFTITYVSGTEDAYTVTKTLNGYTVRFGAVSAKTEYAISGNLNGNIIIDCGDDYKFTLDLNGVNIQSYKEAPVVILSGDNATLSAQKGTENSIIDSRAAVTDDSAYSSAVYSVVDLKLQGKGSLSVYSANNNGIHTKDDLSVKNLTLKVDVEDNALKGNDSVTIESGNLTLIARTGDGIKTSNSGTTFNDDGTVKKQKGNIVLDTTEGDLALAIYAACDGIDAAYDVTVRESGKGKLTLNIYTSSYSGYSEEVTSSGSSTIYLVGPSSGYYYSVAFSNGSSVKWDNGTYYSNVRVGSSSSYKAYSINVPSGCTSMTVYAYSSSSNQGSSSGYVYTTGSISINSSYNALLLSHSGSTWTYSWNTLSTGNGSQGGPGGPQEGNNDKLDYSAKGIKASDCISIEGGTILIKSYDDAVHANSDEAVDAKTSVSTTQGYGKGDVTISGGTLVIYTKDDGIHADGTLAVTGGVIAVKECYEGLEGNTIAVSGGSVSVTSSDDGFNSTSTSGTGIAISGGYVYINAKGDGIDANSKTQYSGIVISGGYIVSICGSNFNSALDTEAGYTFTGGHVVAMTTSGGMSQESSNCKNLSSYGKTATVSISSGNSLNVSGNGETCSVKMSTTMNAYVVMLGFGTSVTASSGSASGTLDDNGVFWS